MSNEIQPDVKKFSKENNKINQRGAPNLYNASGVIGGSGVLIFEDDNMTALFDREDCSSWLEMYLSEENRAGEGMKEEKFDFRVEERDGVMQIGVDKFKMRELDAEHAEPTKDVTPEEEIDYALQQDFVLEEF